MPRPLTSEPSSSTAVPLAELRNIAFFFGTTSVFSNFSLTVQAHEHLALFGRNGSGKSTLLRLLQGELRLPQSIMTKDGEQPQPGSICWGFEQQRDYSALSARKHVRLVSPGQQRHYVRQGWHITGEEILLSGLDNAAMIYGEMAAHHYERAAALAEAAHASHLLPMAAQAMSQGQLRMALILRALMSTPALLLLDEPFDGLDLASRKQVHHVLELAARQDVTLLVTAHRPQDVPDMVSGVLLLENGKITRSTPGKPPFDTLEASAPYHGPPASKMLPSESDATKGAFPDYAPAHDSAFPANGAQPGAPLLELRHVDVFVERCKVLHDLNWRVRFGEHWVVSGPNGSGKSTLLRLLYGEETAAYGGEVLWRGSPRPPLELFRRGVGYVSDQLQHCYDYDLAAEDIVISGMRGTIGLYHEPEEEERKQAHRWLAAMDVAHLAGRPFHSLSTGQGRRVLLARALAASPPVLLLDEPCSGLDGQSRTLFLNALGQLAKQDVSLIFVSHHEQDKSSLFTHELRLDKGAIVYCGPRPGA